MALTGTPAPTARPTVRRTRRENEPGRNRVPAHMLVPILSDDTAPVTPAMLEALRARRAARRA